MNKSPKLLPFLTSRLSPQRWQKQQQEHHDQVMDLLVIAGRLQELSATPGMEQLVTEAAALVEWSAVKLMSATDRARYLNELENPQ